MGGRVPNIFLLFICDSIIREQTLAHFKLTAPGFMVQILSVWVTILCPLGSISSVAVGSIL